MADFVNTSDILGGDILLRKLIDGSLTELKSSHLTSIGRYGLACCRELQVVDLPNVTSIENGGFWKCQKLKSINVPNITSFGENSFQYCSLLTSINNNDFSNLNLSNGALYNTFGYCFSLYNPINTGKAYPTSFVGCGRIVTCTTTIWAGSSYSYAVFSDSYIETLYFPNVTKISSNNVMMFPWLKNMVIGANYNSVCTLSSTPNVLGWVNPAQKRGEFKIYVPDELIEQYKTATNWSVIADKINPLSEFSETHANDPSYIQDFWTTIKQNIDNNNYSQYLNKKKLLLIPGYGWCYMICIAQDADELADETGNAKTTWFCEDCIGTTRRMNPSVVSNTVGTGAIGGYANSEGKGIMDDIYEVLNAEDSELHNIITPVKKYTHVYNMDGTGSSTRNHDVESTEYVWLASYREMFGTDSSFETKGVTYLDYFTDNAIRIKYNYRGASGWWLRSSYTNDYYFRIVNYSGGSNNSEAYNSFGIAFGFCI